MTQNLLLVGRPSPAASEALKVHLDKLGYTFQVASDEAEALRLAKDSAPHAILIDIALPELNGIQICQAIRQRFSDTPIVALNQSEAPLRQAAYSAGADLVVDEPINWGDLHSWLQAPRMADGHPLAEGALMGQTCGDVLGSAALLAHDLKSPISVIISSLEVLLSFADEDETAEPTQRLMRGALNAAYRQLNLVSTLVDLPRLELDNYELQLARIDLTQAVRDGLEKEGYMLEIKGLQTTLDLPESPQIVHADLELLERVITSLIDNVMKFTVRDDQMRVSVTREGKWVALRFTDTGRPIQPGFERDIMTRAPQWERRQAGARTSVALGLPFIHAVAQAHGGSFTVSSGLENKTPLTTFTFCLPAV